MHNASSVLSMKKPRWLNKKVNLSACRKVKGLLRELNLSTICEESLCPNISECFSSGIATFMILGDNCTRSCKFCGVRKAEPSGIDEEEPRRIKEAVKRLNLNYIVITSPSRDDLDDGGAQAFCRTVSEIKNLGHSKRVELLIPDFCGKKESIERVANCGADVIGHNLETVPSLYIKVRKGADYSRSLEVLRLIKEINPAPCRGEVNKKVYTKSGLLLGLGEKVKELLEVFCDLRKVGCDFLTLGQYLPPSQNHYPLKEYLPLKKFRDLEEEAYNLGFKGVRSSPYTRSSYLAHTFISQ